MSEQVAPFPSPASTRSGWSGEGEKRRQGCIRDHNLQVHCFRELEDPKNRRSRTAEVDFVAERIDGAVLPVEVKFRRQITAEDIRGMTVFRKRHGGPCGIVVTRDFRRWDPESQILYLPLRSLLLAF